MALLSLLTQNRPQKVGFKSKENGSDLLIIDATISDSYELTNEVTDSPVEDGIDISDHARIKPITYTIEGEISETPINLQASLQGLVTTTGTTIGRELGGFGTSIGGVVGGFAGARALQNSNNPSKVARDELERMIQKKVIFTIITKNKKLEDMILTSLKFPRAQNGSRTLKFSATAKQIRIVKSKSVQIKNIAKSVSGSASEKKKLGSQTTEVVKNEKASSLLIKLGRSLSSALGGS